MDVVEVKQEPFIEMEIEIIENTSQPATIYTSSETSEATHCEDRHITEKSSENESKDEPSTEEIPDLFTAIVKAVGSNDKVFKDVTLKHVEVLHTYLAKVERIGKNAFSTRDEYLDFATGQLWIDKINFMGKGNTDCVNEENIGPEHSILATFDDISKIFLPDKNGNKKTKRDNFLNTVKRGDVLDLRVVEETKTEFKLIVVNKYLETERLCDYVIYVYLIKSQKVQQLPFQLRLEALVRGTVFGYRGEDLLVTLTLTFLVGKYKDKNIKLGQIFKLDIPYDDAYKFKDARDYINSHPCMKPNSETLSELVSFEGLDPHRIYSFNQHLDGKKCAATVEYKSAENQWNKAIEHMNTFSKFFEDWKNPKGVIQACTDSIEIYPENDVAYRRRAEKHSSEANGNEPDLYQAYKDYEFALKLNPYHEPTIVEYAKIVILMSKKSIIRNDPLQATKALQNILLLNKMYEDKYGIPDLGKQEKEEAMITDERMKLYRNAKKLLRIADQKQTEIDEERTPENMDTSELATSPSSSDELKDEKELEEKMKNMDTDSEDDIMRQVEKISIESCLTQPNKNQIEVDKNTKLPCSPERTKVQIKTEPEN